MRATSLGVYRFWRDLGFVFGAIGVGFIADLSSNGIAVQLVAWIAIASGVFVLLIMKKARKQSETQYNQVNSNCLLLQKTILKSK